MAEVWVQFSRTTEEASESTEYTIREITEEAAINFVNDLIKSNEPIMDTGIFISMVPPEKV